MYNRSNSVFFNDTTTFRHRIATATAAASSVTAAKSVHKRWEYLAKSVSSVPCAPFTLCVFILVLRVFFFPLIRCPSLRCVVICLFTFHRAFLQQWNWAIFFFIFTIEARINFDLVVFLCSTTVFDFVTAKRFLRFLYSNFLACILRFSNKARKKNRSVAVVRRWWYRPTTIAKERNVHISFSSHSHTTRFYFGVLSSFYCCCCCTCIAAFFRVFVLCACVFDISVKILRFPWHRRIFRPQKKNTVYVHWNTKFIHSKEKKKADGKIDNKENKRNKTRKHLCLHKVAIVIVCMENHLWLSFQLDFDPNGGHHTKPKTKIIQKQKTESHSSNSDEWQLWNKQQIT